MSNPSTYCGLPGCLVCGPRNRPRWDNVGDLMRRMIESDERWRQREAARLRRLYPQPSQRLVEEIEARRTAR